MSKILVEGGSSPPKGDLSLSKGPRTFVQWETFSPIDPNLAISASAVFPQSGVPYPPRKIADFFKKILKACPIYQIKAHEMLHYMKRPHVSIMKSEMYERLCICVSMEIKGGNPMKIR